MSCEALDTFGGEAPEEWEEEDGSVVNVNLATLWSASGTNSDPELDPEMSEMTSCSSV